MERHELQITSMQLQRLKGPKETQNEVERCIMNQTRLRQGQKKAKETKELIMSEEKTMREPKTTKMERRGKQRTCRGDDNTGMKKSKGTK